MIMRFSIADGNGELTGKFVVVWFLLSFGNVGFLVVLRSGELGWGFE